MHKDEIKGQHMEKGSLCLITSLSVNNRSFVKQEHAIYTAGLIGHRHTHTHCNVLLFCISTAKEEAYSLPSVLCFHCRYWFTTVWLQHWSHQCPRTETAHILPECVYGAVWGAFQPRSQYHGLECCCSHLQCGRHDRVFLSGCYGQQIWQAEVHAASKHPGRSRWRFNGTVQPE